MERSSADCKRGLALENTSKRLDVLNPIGILNLFGTRSTIRDCKVHLDHLTQQLEALVGEEKLPHGLGALTVSLPDGEVCDWNRFKHRKAVGSYTGCCPSDKAEP
ncbi:MAG TPA: hypothetical protein VFM25_06855 [Verrucomicrobiae bacterium]|nr:hypothetical protein [Verrucomicrobiae bacterium]